MKVSWGDVTSGSNRAKTSWLAAGLCLSMSMCGAAFAQGGVTNNTDPDVALVTTTFDGPNAVRSNGDGTFDIDLLFTVTNPNTITTPTPNVFDSITRLVLPIGGSTFDSATLSQDFVFTPNATNDGNDLALPLLNGDVAGAPVYNGTSVPDVTPNGTTVSLEIPLEPTQPTDTAPGPNVREFRIAIRGYESNGSSGPYQLIQSSGPESNKNICSVLNRNTTSSARCEIVGLSVTLPVSAIGDKVFIDADGDGVQTGSEAGIQGVTIDLIDSNTSAVIATATTDANGNYLFSGLQSGNYRTVVTDTAGVLAAAGYTQTFEADGTLNGSIDTALPNDTTNLTRDFGYAVLGNIGDTVFNDLNGNGVQDAGENGIDGVTITLRDSGGVIVGSQVTSGGGLYDFTGLAADTYTVTVTTGAGTPVAGFSNSPAAADSAGVNASNGTNVETVVLGAGDDYNAADFGYIAPITIGDRVFNDANGDGDDENGADAGIAGVLVFVDLNGNGQPDVGEPSDTTDGNGAYDITGVLPGSYNVVVDSSTLPAGVTLSTGNQPFPVTVQGGDDVDDADFGFSLLGSIGDTVFNDLNGNGVLDAGESGIDGVTLTLRDGSGAVVGTPQVTSGGGLYDFTGLVAGVYTVTVTTGPGTPIDGFTNSPAAADSAGNASNGTNVESVVLGAGDDYDAADFGYIAPITIGDRVFNDANGDGDDEGGADAGIAGVLVFVDINGNGIPDVGEPSDTTDGTGAYDITGVLPGSYNVVVDSNTLPTDVTLSTGNQPFPVTVQGGDDVNDADFGYAELATIGDTVFNDIDGDGAQGPGEAGIPGIIVFVDLDGDGVQDPDEPSDTTDGNGNYTISGVPANTPLTVVVANPPLDQATNNPGSVDPIAPGETNNDVDFGFRELVNIGDTVFEDLNGNGVQDGAETGVSGVLVTLTDSSGAVRSTTTDANGEYSFTDVPVGSTTVEIALPANFVNTFDRDGGLDNTSTFTIAVDDLDFDFGIQGQATIGDTVFNDVDGDGAQGSGEAGIPGIIVFVDLDGDGVQDPNEPTGTTNGNGNYSISGVPANTPLTVIVANPPLDQATNNPGSVDPIAPGETNNDVDFGFRELVNIGDTVFEDLNGNGVLDGAETGVSGVLVTLTDSTGATRDTTTDANGEYGFTDVPVGRTRVDIVLPANFVNTFDRDGGLDNTSTFTITGDDLGFDFGIQGQATIGDTVFNDIDGDGVQDPNEDGIPNILVFVDLDGDGVQDPDEPSDTTDANGNYSIPGVPANTPLTVVVANPPLDQATNNPGSVDPIAPGDTNNDVDFGFRDLVSVGDTVFEDLNGNGVQDGAEAGVSGVLVTLTDSTGATRSTTTDANGEYGFADVPVGSTTVGITLPANFVNTFDRDGGLDNTSTFTIAADDLDFDFGIQGQATLGDTVFNDIDGDGVQDPSEDGIPNILVFVDLDGDGVQDPEEPSDTTDGNGNYSISGVPANTPLTVIVANPPLDQATNNPGSVDPIAPGDTNNDVDFGFRDVVGIGDTVFEDYNGNGVQDGAEPGVAGVQVTLTDSSGATQTATTNGNGNYLFQNVPVGSTTVEIVVPANFVNTFDRDGGLDNTSTFITTGNDLDFDFGIQGQATLGDTVFNDIDGDGIQDPDEDGIPNILVFVDLDGDGVQDPEEPSDTTDGNGNYSISGVPANTPLTVVVANPPLDQATNNPGSVDPIAPGDTNNDVDFGFRELVNIGDTVFEDRNGNGVQDGAEAGVPGVLVTLTDSTGATRNTTTDANGEYGFTDLPVGSTTVQIVVPANFVNTFDRDGGLDSTSNFTITGDDLEFDFGIQGQATLGDTVFNDIDGDGVQDAGEAGIPGIIVFVDLDGDGVQDPNEPTGTTNGNGNYSIPGVPANTPLTVIVANPPLDQATNNPGSVDPIAPGGTNNEVDFGFRELVNIGDTVFEDLNGNGVQDGAEAGVPSVLVTLTDSAGATRSTTTDANGEYSFADVPVGSTTVAITLPANFVNTFDRDGGLDNTSNFTITGDDLNFDFGIQQQASVGDTVFNDLNGNGVQDGAEQGVGGITVTLTDANGASQTTTTDANGVYGFDNVPVGETQVSITLPTGFVNTFDRDGGLDNTSTFTIVGDDLDFDFGIQGQGVVGDTVFNDLDGDGIQDSNEPGIADVVVTLTDSNGVVSTTTTDANGVYGFQNVPIGGTTVSIAPPVGFEATGDRDGVADNTSTELVGTTGDLDFDFGLAQPVIGIAKQASASVATTTAGEFETTITLRVENLGGLPLSNVNIVDDLSTVFPAPATYEVVPASVTSPTLTAVTAYNGAGNNTVATGSLAIGANAEVSFVVRYQSNNSTSTTYNNQAVANGEGPGGTPTSDDSDDGTDPDPNGDDTPTDLPPTDPVCVANPLADGCEDDPTPITPPTAPQIAIAKQASASVATANAGEFVTTITLNVANIGNTPLTNVSIVDDLSAVFASPATFNVVAGTLAVNGLTEQAGYDGTSANSVLATGDLALGATATVEFDVAYQPNTTAATTYLNQAVASGDSPTGTPTTDNSDDGTDPDPNNDGTPTDLPPTDPTCVANPLADGCEDDPTPITPPDLPQIGIAKTATASQATATNGEFETTINLFVENLGPTELNNVEVIDDLSAVFTSPATFAVSSVTANGLTAITSYDGTLGNTTAATGSLAVGATATVSFVVRYMPNNGNVEVTYENQAVANGESPDGATTTDNSDDGTNPDPNNDDVPTDLPPNDPVCVADPTANGCEDDPTPITPPRTGNALIDLPGIVFNDVNANGINDSEAGVPGVTVTLLDSNGNPVGNPTTTDANGQYVFTGLTADDYSVQFTLPDDFVFTAADTGSDETLDSDVIEPATGQTARFGLDENTADDGLVDAGIFARIPAAVGDLLIAKVANKSEVSVGDTVRYTITVTNPGNAAITATNVYDNSPAGFFYIPDSARLIQSGVTSVIPAVGKGPVDYGPIANIAPSESVQITYLMRVGAGVIGDEQINRAQAFDGPFDPVNPPTPRSDVATAVVLLAQDPIFDKTTIIGKVFHDRDADGWQDNANATGVAVILGTPSLYVPGSVTVDYGRGPQRVASDLSRGITIGEISGRTSVADPFEFHRVTVRAEMTSAQLDNILVGTREGTRIQLSANDVRSEGHVGKVERGMSGQDIRITRIISGNTMMLTITNHGIHEEGLPGVRLATVGGLLIETDQHGRYHVADVDGGRMSAGRNYILKVDPYTLPRNSTFTTENPRVLRITRGLMNKINFGVRIPVEEMKNEKIIEARLGEVFFDTDRDTIRPEYRPAIAKMARTIMKYRSGRLAIEGHADKRHNARYNLDLARRRAASVRSALEKLLPPGTFRNVEIFVDSPQEVIQNQMDTNEAHPEWRDSQTSVEPRSIWNKALGAVLGLMVSTAHADEIVLTDPSMSEPFMTEVRESFNGGGTVFEDALLKAGARTGKPWELRLELRDGESSELIDAIPLSEGGDYDIDVSGGRVTLRQPMHEIVLARSNKVSDGKQVYLFADNDPLTVTLAYADIEDLQRGSNNDNVVGDDVAGYDVEVISRGEGDPRANQLSTAGLQDNRRVDVRAKWRVALPNGGAIWLTEDPLQLDPRLDVVATSTANIVNGKLEKPVEFATYTNYGAFIDRWELLIYGINDDDLARPLALVKGKTLKNGEPIVWRGSARAPLLDDGQMKYVMRVYDARGRYDETAPRVLQFFNGEESDRDLPTAGDIYGLSNIARRIIPIHGSRIRMYGRDLAANNSIRVNGDPVPVEGGRYFAEWLMPVGEHAFNIDLTDENGNNWPRQLVAKVDGNAFFGVAIADVTIGQNNVGTASAALQNDDHFDEDTFVDGRFAFYVKAKRAAKYTITAQMDTREDELSNLFDDIHKKDASSLVRRLDADRYYGTYGDDSTTVSDVDSYGRIYGRVEWDNSQALWGNYTTGFTGTEFAEFNRSLYGAQLRYNSVDQTKMGDTRTQLSAFGAEQQTAQGYNRFLGTGGSLYYLSNQDIVQGSEKIAVEVRSRDSDRILENITLERGLDYEIDEIQGRVILSRALHQVVGRTNPSLVKDQPLDGDEVFLVVDYEYVPVDGFNADKGTYGVRGKHWVGNNIAVGGTYTTESRDGQDSELKGVDLVFKAAKGTYIKAEYVESEAQQALENQLSIDGGLNFTGSQFDRAQAAGVGANRDGQAYSVEARYNGLDYGSNDMQVAVWTRKRNDEFSSARYNDGIDTEELGAELDWALSAATRFSVRYIDNDRENTSEERVASVQLATDVTESLTVSAEVQNRDYSNLVSNTSDDSTRGALGVSYEVNRSWTIYGIGQGTFDGDTNDLLTLGVKTGVTDRLSLILEGSTGNKGEAIEVGVDYRLSDTQEVYGSYTLSTDRTDGDRNVATIGNRRQVSNQLNVFNEFQFSHGERNAGIGHVFGIDYDTEGGWTVGLSAQHSNLKDNTVNTGNAVIERSAATITTRYRGEKTELYTKAEFRADDGAVDRDQWLGVVRLDRKVSENFRWLTKFAYSYTEQQDSDLDDARFAEFDLGFAYRPVLWDRWNILGKYTFLSDSGAFDGTTTATTQSGQANVRDEERSHVVSLEGIYDISRKWELGAKYAWKTQETRIGTLGRDEGPWSKAKLNLGVLRLRYHMLHNWDGLAEYRVLLTDDSDAGTDSKKAGGLLAIYRHLGANFKVGVGYNFTDFSDDLTRSDDYDASGWFINLIGKY